MLTLIVTVLCMGTCGAAPIPGRTLSIGRMTQPPALDGHLSDWPADASVILLGQAADRIRRPGNWAGAQDLSGAVRLAWDSAYLYLAADVCDDRLMQASGPAEVWQGDTLELFFNIHPQQQRVDGFWQIALVPPLRPEAKLQATGPQKDFEGVEGTTQVHTNGYTLECRIPWRNLTGFVPAEGANLGFQLFLDDRDGSGRKSQLVWYPSAITFCHPADTGTLILRTSGDTALPRVLAGAATACVTDAQHVRISVIADVAGQRATITPHPPFPAGTTRVPNPVTIDLQPVGERIHVGQGDLNIEGVDGLLGYTVTVADGEGRILAAHDGELELAGGPYARMRSLQDAVTKRLASLPAVPGEADPLPRAGLAAWLERHRAFVGNEARAECLNRPLLDHMLQELTNLDLALAELEAGRDPYVGRNGSLVRAYRSPLTGQPRPYALFVPPSYRPDATNTYPLIVLLHGIFADERQLALLTDTFRDLGAIVYQGASYRQFDWGGISATETWAGLDDLQRHYRIDEDHMVLVGYHSGGRGVWQLATSRPDRWAAVAPLFGGIDGRPEYPALRLYPEMFDQSVAVQIPAPHFRTPPRPAPLTAPLERDLFTQASLVPRLDNVRGLPVRSAFGEDDPEAAAERLVMQQRLAELGTPFVTRYAPGAMHGSMPEEIEDPGFYRELLAHGRPPMPHNVTFVAAGLRYNAAWWVRVDGLSSPCTVARVAARCEGGAITVRTTNTVALTLLPDTRLAAAGTPLAVQIDGAPAGTVTATAPPSAVSFVCDAAGHWSAGKLSDGVKRHGLSGPINDFQCDRFLFVYGTGGGSNEQTRLAALGKRMADWGLGAVFTCKADREVTDDDLRTANVLVIGTPHNNAILARIEAKLPLRWTDSGLRLGEESVEGPDAGACLIYPNPLAPERYVVVITATGEAGYQIWSQRAPGGDYVLGRVKADEKATGFQVTARGWFDNQWQWDKALCLRVAGEP